MSFDLIENYFYEFDMSKRLYKLISKRLEFLHNFISYDRFFTEL
jgi:hypothetical protein